MGRFLKSKLTLGLCAFLLASCASQPSSTISTKIQQAPYKRLVQYASDQGDLQAALEVASKRNRTHLVRNPDDFAEFRVMLNTQVARINTLETKPKLMGRLSRTKTPVNFKVDYKITNISRHILSEGHIEEVTETLSAIYPKLSLSKEIEPEALQKVTQKIYQDVVNQIIATPWSSTIIGQKDDRHVSIYTGEDAGLQIGDVFMTESKPYGKLTVVMFETTANGLSRAILALNEGFLPNVGSKIIPAKK